MSQRIFNLSSVQLLLEKYSRLTKDEIMGQVSDWFNAVGKDEFESAKKSELIIQTKDNPKTW
jgi:hypothetical protein